MGPRRRRCSGRLVAALACTAVLASACSGGGGADSGSPSTTGGTETSTQESAPTTTITVPVDVDALPAEPTLPEAFTITYRVERPREAATAVDTEIRTAEPPFDSRVETRRDEPESAGELVLVDIEVMGAIELGPLGQQRTLVVVQPGPASRGGWFDTDTGAAADAGVVVSTGKGYEIVGRRCTEIRTGSPLDGGVLVAPSTDDHSDVCIDDDGLVLREEVTVGGKVTVRRTAVKVATTPPPDGAFAPLGWRLPEAEGGGRVRRVTADSRPPGVDHHQLGSPPTGFAHVGRFGVATDTSPGPNAAGAADRLVSVVDVYRNGTEVVTVENGALVSGGRALADGPVAVESERFPGTTAAFSTTGVEVRVTFDDGRFLRMRGTGRLDDLLAMLDSLETISGNGEVMAFDDQEDVTGRLRSPTPDHGHGADDQTHDDARPDDHAHP